MTCLNNIGRFNIDGRGKYLGSFNLNDKILVIYTDGTYEMTSFDLSNRYNMTDVKFIEKFDKNLSITLLYYNGKNKNYFVKRFLIETSIMDKRFMLISDFRGSKLISVSSKDKVIIKYNYRTKNGDKKEKSVLNSDVVDIKGWKAAGNRLDDKLIQEIEQLGNALKIINIGLIPFIILSLGLVVGIRKAYK